VEVSLVRQERLFLASQSNSKSSNGVRKRSTRFVSCGRAFDKLRDPRQLVREERVEIDLTVTLLSEACSDVRLLHLDKNSSVTMLFLQILNSANRVRPEMAESQIKEESDTSRHVKLVRRQRLVIKGFPARLSEVR
jgi:hypothetical protein